MDAKEQAARAALERVKAGMTLGLGTGSTARVFIDLLAADVASGRLAGVRGVPTSLASDQQARAAGIEIVGFDVVTTCDLTIDGADEIDSQLNLIKGLGGALLREKLVAQNSRELVIIADESKRVKTLGTKGPLPVEATVFGHQSTERFLRSLGCVPVLRPAGSGVAYVTDNGNYIYDCRFPTGIADPAALDHLLRGRAGVVETGLFIGIAKTALVGTADRVIALTRDPR